MEKHQFSKGIEEIKKVGLTEAERSAIFSRIIDKTKSALINPMPAPKSKLSWVQNIFAGYRLRPALVAFALVLILGGGGIVLGANQTLPGNILYPFKVGVVEPLVGSLMAGETKANYQVSLVTKRLSEAETLAAGGQLDQVKQLQLQNLIAENTSALNTTLASIDSQTNESGTENSGNSGSRLSIKSSAPVPTVMSAPQVGIAVSRNNDKTDAIRLNFEASMNAHARLLEAISNEKLGTTSGEVLNVASQARESGQAVGNDQGSQNNSQTSTDNNEQNKKGGRGGKIINFNQMPVQPLAVATSSVQTENQAGLNESFDNQIQSVQSIIENTKKYTDNVDQNSTPLVQTIASGTVYTLNQAESLLNKAKQEHSKQNRSQADSALRQSEKSAKEAEIFIKAGVKFGKNQN